MNNPMHDILWRRLKYALTPQHDIYQSLREKVTGGAVLDVGFGTGAGVLQYAMAAERVDAIEIDPGAVHFAREMFPLSNVQWIESDITKHVPGNDYDFVVMIETLEHIADWRAALGMCEFLLKEGGYLFMSARNANADLRRQKDLHEREWTAAELLDALGEFFPSVYIYDYLLKNQQSNTTSVTPLMAMAKKRV